MKTISGIEELRAEIAECRREGRTIGFVPTMGALHVGHAALMQAAGGRGDVVVVSIFVNPTQFGPGEDFEKYPRNLERDLELCREAGVRLVFVPRGIDMYPSASTTVIHVPELGEGLCGPHRPGHFDGVATIVTKLFHIVTPDVALFGEKDYQQLKVIERLVRELNLPVQVVGCPTVREEDGLAVSSRNAYLSRDERRQASCLYRALAEAAEAMAAGETDSAALIARMTGRVLQAGPAKIDYIAIVDPRTLRAVNPVRGPVRICLAVRIGGCRLIDNVAASPGGPVRREV